jgi:hypothetical protein
MRQSDVILTPVPQADGRVKNRPAIILREMPSYGDLLVCGVSTQLHQYVHDFEVPFITDDYARMIIIPMIIWIRYICLIKLAQPGLKKRKGVILKNFSFFLIRSFCDEVET